MKLALCFTARDEQDIVETMIRWHVSQGVDLVLVEEAFSSDDTPHILDRLARELPVVVNHTRRSHAEQAQAMTELQAQAYALGADWVINSDADEFWVSRYGSLWHVFAAIPPDIGFVRAEIDEYASDQTLLPHHRSWSGERLAPKVAHRPSPSVTVQFANVSVSGTLPGTRPLADLRVLHWPLRSPEQAASKCRNLSLPVPGRAVSCDDHYRRLEADPSAALAVSGLPDARLAGILRDHRTAQDAR